MDSTYMVILTATSEDGVCTDQATQEVVIVFPDTSTIGVGSWTRTGVLKAGPVPFGQAALSRSSWPDIAEWTVRDALGRVVRTGGPQLRRVGVAVGADGMKPGWHVLVSESTGRHWSCR